MVKQLVDLSKDEDEKVRRFILKWTLNKTDVIKKMIRDFPDNNEDILMEIDNLL